MKDMYIFVSETTHWLENDAQFEKAGLENDTLEEHIKEKVASTNHKF